MYCLSLMLFPLIKTLFLKIDADNSIAIYLTIRLILTDWSLTDVYVKCLFQIYSRQSSVFAYAMLFSNSAWPKDGWRLRMARKNLWQKHGTSHFVGLNFNQRQRATGTGGEGGAKNKGWDWLLNFTTLFCIWSMGAVLFITNRFPQCTWRADRLTNGLTNHTCSWHHLVPL